MSLAVSSGVGGAGGAHGGGMMMAHQANAVGVPPAAQQHTQTNATSSGPPTTTSAAALGADLIDKNQTGLTMKQVRNRQHLPIVAIDLHATGNKAPVALFPKKSEDPSKGEPPLFVTEVDTDLKLKRDDDVAHKTLKKFLSKSKTYSALREDTLFGGSVVTSDSKVNKNKKDKTTPTKTTNASVSVAFEKPHQWLGLRRLDQAPNFMKNRSNVRNIETPIIPTMSSNLNHAISEESSADVGVIIENSTLDGVSQPKNDDFDRVVAKVRLHSSKKAVTILPEEAVQIFLHSAQHAVAEKVQELSDNNNNTKKKSKGKNSNNDHDEEEILDYPIVIALPAWAMHDSIVEALLDATEGTGVLVPRSVAACAGALLLALDGSATPILTRINVVRTALKPQHEKRSLTNESLDTPYDGSVVLLLFGMADTGFECTAIQINTINMNNISCLFGDFKVLSNVSFQHENPISVMEKCSTELEEAIETVYPESDGPAGIIFYGSTTDQQMIATQWDKIKNKQTDWSKVPTFVTDADAVARGTAVMGAVAHGRLTKNSITTNSSGKKKVNSRLGIKVQSVALAAVGVAYNYHGSDKDSDTKWTPVKTLFDFDRQTPAGPHSIELSAAECVVHREHDINVTKDMGDEEFMKLIAQYEGAKGIPAREIAALNLRVQVYEKWTRDGEWIKVGDPIEPLVAINNTTTKDGEETRTACERIILDLSLAITGMITTSLNGERTSVVVATKEARNSKIRWYLGVLFLILFCGGFLFKSWYDDFVLERDTKRLLAYYKRVVPGSILDGDERNARWTCYKFRSKKAKLWRKLESKYGEPVLHPEDYLKENVDDEDDPTKTASKGKEKNEGDDEPIIDLDEDENKKADTDEL